MNTERLLTAVVLVVVLGGGGCAGEDSREELVKEIGVEVLVNAAWKTQIAFVQAGKPDPEGLVPRQYWAEPIRRLKPVKVYLHRVNVVVVTREEKQREEGLYIYIPISSYIPMAGTDGFKYKALARDIHAFQRQKP